VRGAGKRNYTRKRSCTEVEVREGLVPRKKIKSGYIHPAAEEASERLVPRTKLKSGYIHPAAEEASERLVPRTKLKSGYIHPVAKETIVTSIAAGSINCADNVPKALEEPVITTDRIYCKSNACLDRVLSMLHTRLLEGDDTANCEIDACILPCSILNSLQVAKDQIGEASYVSHVHPTSGTSTNTCMHSMLTCLCMKREHEIHIKKVGYVQQFDMHCPKNMTNHARSGVGKGLKGCSIPLESLFGSKDCLQYDSLPDIGSFIRASLQRRFFTPALIKNQDRLCNEEKLHAQCNDRGKTPVVNLIRTPVVNTLLQGICCSILQESIPCLKRTKRRKEASWVCENSSAYEVVACINIMHGTMLRLYPHASKQPTFTARVNIVSRLSLLLADNMVHQIQFLNEYPSLVKICFMEYTMNMLKDYMPCERKLILSSEMLQLYETMGLLMCDNFRQDAIVTGNESWKEMDTFAEVNIEKCMRICKFKMLRITEPRIKRSLDAKLFDPAMLQFKYMYNYTSNLKELYVTANEATATYARTIHESLICYPLPHWVYEEQLRSMSAMHGACSYRYRAVQYTHICVVCAINNKLNSSKMRMCSVTGDVNCVTCPTGTIVKVDMLGILLKICNTSYYMCPICTNFTIWHADGHDLCPDFMKYEKVHTIGNGCVCQCTDHVKYLSRYTPLNQLCEACNTTRAAKHVIIVPDLNKRVMQQVHLCKRHIPTEHMMKHVYNTTDLKNAISEHTSQRKRYF
jgi:hypothetical protein